MSASKKKNQLKYRPFEAKPFPLGEEIKNGTRRKTGKQCYAAIWSSMLQNKTFKSLSIRQRLLYVYCKMQQMYQNRTQEEIEIYKSDTFFTFERYKWKDLYELYTDNNHKQFYSDMKVLIEKGFIKVIASGKSTMTKNIYDFDSRWTKE